jgi:hypothetical protein
MRYFIDTEFCESGQHKPIDLISIGIVAEDERMLYLVSNEFDPEACNAWVKEHVLTNLYTTETKSLDQIAQEILKFIDLDKPEFWGYYSDYDWVVFCQIFGAMINLPHGWPMYCLDIKQLADGREIPIECVNEHHALSDANWNKLAYNYLVGLKG